MINGKEHEKEITAIVESLRIVTDCMSIVSECIIDMEGKDRLAGKEMSELVLKYFESNAATFKKHFFKDHLN